MKNENLLKLLCEEGEALEPPLVDLSTSFCWVGAHSPNNSYIVKKNLILRLHNLHGEVEIAVTAIVVFHESLK